MRQRQLCFHLSALINISLVTHASGSRCMGIVISGVSYSMCLRVSVRALKDLSY